MPKSLPLADGRQDGAVPPLSEERAAEIIADLNQPRAVLARARLYRRSSTRPAAGLGKRSGRVAKRRTTTLAFRFCGWETLSESPFDVTPILSRLRIQVSRGAPRDFYRPKPLIAGRMQTARDVGQPH
jgi:hypothetical protein